MQIWRVNTKSHTFSIEETPKSWERLGGRGLLAKIMLDEVDPECDPLGPRNKLIYAPGLLTGHRLSSLDRISIGGKSPLTGGVKEANAGGRTGYHLANLGIKALILEERPAEDNWMVIFGDPGKYQTFSGIRFATYSTTSLTLSTLSELE